MIRLRSTDVVGAWLGLAFVLQPGFQDTFPVDRASLGPAGGNAYFTLEPGRQSVLEGGATRLVITVTPDVKVVDGVRTRVVEERETEGGKLVEVSRNFFAFSAKDSGVYYFGEDVDVYKDEIVANHEGSWRAGVGGARFGLMMPAHPRVGQRFHQEVAPGAAMDRAEVLSVSESLRVPAAAYRQCVRMKETTPLEPGATEFKVYCPEVGLVLDGDLRLARTSGGRR